MSKIHNKTNNKCMICGELTESIILFHKTRRQTHGLCMECCVGYLKPFIDLHINNIHKNIRINLGRINCPGTTLGLHRNICKKTLNISDISLPVCDINLRKLMLEYLIVNKNAYVCPENTCNALTVFPQRINKSVSIVTCMGCRISWCSVCSVSPYHTDISCAEYELSTLSTLNGSFLKDMREQGILKNCPNCLSTYSKNIGCNKIVCHICRCKWCWLCSETNIDYDHYNYDMEKDTRCKGKLWEENELELKTEFDKEGKEGKEGREEKEEINTRYTTHNIYSGKKPWSDIRENRQRSNRYIQILKK
jgi:hypothetical protein